MRAWGDFKLRGPNDLVFDKSGGFWFTDFGKGFARTRDRGGLYYAKPDGSLIEGGGLRICWPEWRWPLAG